MKIFDKLVGLLGKTSKPIEERIEESTEIPLEVVIEEEEVVSEPVKEPTISPEVVTKPKKPKASPAPSWVTIEELSFHIDACNLDEAEGDVEVKGSGDEPYRVDIWQLSCTCGDFTKTRTEFPANDIRRLCKHQVSVITNSKQVDQVETVAVLKIMLKNLGGRSFQRYSSALEIKINEPIDGPDVFYLFQEDGRDWVDVIIVNDDTLKKFGFNLKKKQWARRANPFPKASKGKYIKAMKMALDNR